MKSNFRRNCFSFGTVFCFHLDCQFHITELFCSFFPFQNRKKNYNTEIFYARSWSRTRYYWMSGKEKFSDSLSTQESPSFGVYSRFFHSIMCTLASMTTNTIKGKHNFFFCSQTCTHEYAKCVCLWRTHSEWNAQ